MGWVDFPVQDWKWACAVCTDPRSKAVELQVVATDGRLLIAKALCRDGHLVACGQCAISTEYVLSENPPHLEARCRGCDAYVKFVDRDGACERERVFQPSGFLKQKVRERDKTCRFCNFDVTARLQEAISDPHSVPAISDVTEKMLQRLIADRRRELEHARILSFFDVSDFAARSELDLAEFFFNLTDSYAQAALHDGQRMMQFDHLLPVQYIRRIARSFSDDQLRVLGQECVVLCCNVCNNTRKEHLEDEPYLLELYLRIFLSRFRRVPDAEWKKFQIFARAVRDVHRLLESESQTRVG